MQFFCTKNRYEQWRKTRKNTGRDVELLDIERAVEAARKIFEIR